MQVYPEGAIRYLRVDATNLILETRSTLTNHFFKAAASAPCVVTGA
jgi:hypothetical protein